MRLKKQGGKGEKKKPFPKGGKGPKKERASLAQRKTESYVGGRKKRGKTEIQVVERLTVCNSNRTGALPRRGEFLSRGGGRGNRRELKAKRACTTKDAKKKKKKKKKKTEIIVGKRNVGGSVT